MAILEISSASPPDDRDEEMSAPGLRKNFERHLAPHAGQRPL